jgi:methionyl-tRNA synthetase
MDTPNPNGSFYLTTAIPYVNAAPHVGFAMELILADVLARFRRLRGDDLRFVTGTDDHALKNVRAAESEGISTTALVERNAAAFRGLRDTLGVATDDFLRTSVDPRHRRGVEALWRACAAAGDVYRRAYRGQYCVGCEQFYAPADLVDGRCPEHGTVPEVVEEDNYFFRLSRHAEALAAAIESGALRIVPDSYRREVLAFVRRGLDDFSISRSQQRARGWGIPVPDDPGQVMYVWFDALGNYITALDYADEGPLFHRYWRDSAERVHLIGKGITRFHAVYWPAMLLSAGLPLPTTIWVHGYLTVDGKKIGKSLGNAIDPAAIVARCGLDAVRYFVTRHVRSGQDGDFELARVEQVRRAELGDQLGNLLRRTVDMIERYCGGAVPEPDPATQPPFAERAETLRERVERGVDDLRLDEVVDAVWGLVEASNRYAVEQAPWQLAKKTDDAEAGSRLRTALYNLAESLRLAGHYLAPVMPAAAEEIHRQLGAGPIAPWDRATRWGWLPPGARVRSGPILFPRPH